MIATVTAAIISFLAHPLIEVNINNVDCTKPRIEDGVILDATPIITEPTPEDGTQNEGPQ